MAIDAFSDIFILIRKCRSLNVINFKACICPINCDVLELHSVHMRLILLAHSTFTSYRDISQNNDKGNNNNDDFF